ncbi:MAG TPA: hypothetical protein VLH19_02735 [Patescibacteria group bacterium]|nr:hypothetical protein [Patescibacteria group bacterium]
MHRIFVLCFFVMTLFVFLRSGLYAIRTAQEFLHPPGEFHPEVTACSSFFATSSGELRGLYNYRHLGAVCEN